MRCCTDNITVIGTFSTNLVSVRMLVGAIGRGVVEACGEVCMVYGLLYRDVT